MQGWILDLYPGNPGEVVVWLKLESGEVRRFVERWAPSLFVASDSMADLTRLSRAKEIAPDVSESRLVSRYEQITDKSRSDVLEIRVKDAKRLPWLASTIESLGPSTYRIYNSDVPPAQTYLYEHDLFPLAYCKVSETSKGLDWELQDSVWSYDYRTPEMSSIAIQVDIHKEGKLVRDTDKIRSILVKGRNEEVSVEDGSEEDKLLELVETIRRIDPDMILTEEGDTFLFPYLVKRAIANGVSDRFKVDRDQTTMKLPAKPGTSYFSYGKILFKPAAIKLSGRLHLDMSNSSSSVDSGLEGLFELSRICRMPLQTSSRASIGKALSSLQFYNATRRGLLIPWKPTLAEHFKNRCELLIADRGGFLFEPRVGTHENIAELDFTSLFPNIMYKKNLSAETVRCSCCPDSDNRIPELNWNVCRKMGIVPTSVEIIVAKRIRYKELKSRVNKDSEAWHRYDSRVTALKWIGVTTFGYLGFNNAKFGRIDAHIGVCAWDRKIMIDSTRVAERRGFTVMHGIVDSLWLKKDGADGAAYRELMAEIVRETGFEMSYEGIYRWIAFPPSKTDPNVPVLNRYFGVYDTGELKIRGIEARRHDTPKIFYKCQMDILNTLAKTHSIEEAKRTIPACVEIFVKYSKSILNHEAPMEEMVFSKFLSNVPEEYANETIEASVGKRLAQEGAQLHAGEDISYVITDYSARSGRAVGLDLIDESTTYDAKRYIELLAETCSTVLEPFDSTCDRAGLLGRFENSISEPLLRH